ncbi:MAG: hypothetical protein CME63_14120 [Halobacteriovoraceae bacterium]|nr:hypothetical protein [Halobacteriovoraceae bacterium]
MILFNRVQAFLFLFVVVGVIILTIPSRTKLGILYFNSYQYEKTLEYLSESESLKTGDVLVLKKIKDYFTLQGDIKRALEVMEKLHTLRPHNLDYLKELEKLSDWNQLPVKRLYYQEKRAELLKGKSDREKLLLEIAQGYRYLRDFKEANRVFQKIENSENRMIQEQMISYYLATKQADKAIESIEAYKKKLKDNSEVRLKYNIYLYQSFTVLEDYKRAIIQAFQILGINKLDSVNEIPKEVYSLSKQQVKDNLYYLEGIIYHYEKLELLGNSEELTLFLANTVPVDTELQFNLAEFWFRHNDKSKAKSKYVDILKRDRLNREEMLSLVDRFYDLGEKGRAIDALKRLVKRYPLNRAYWQRLGDLYDEIGEKKKALEAFLKLLELEKKKNQTYIRTYLRQGPQLAMNSSSDDVIFIKKYQNLPKFNSRIYQIEQRIVYLLNEIGDPEEVIKVVERLLNDDPNSSVLLSALAQAYYMKGDYKRAEKLFERVIRLEPNHKMALEVLLAKDIREKNFEKANGKIKTLEKLSNEIKNSEELYLLSMKEEVFFQEAGAESKSYKEICQVINDLNSSQAKNSKGSVNFELQSIRLRCLRRRGEEEKAFQLNKSLVAQYPEELILREQLAYLYLDRGDVESAKKELDVLILKSDQPEIQYKALNEYYNSSLLSEKRKNAWRLVTDNYHLWTSEFSFSLMSIEVAKLFNDFAIGLGEEFYLLNKGGNEKINYNELFFEYRLSLNQLIRLQLGISTLDKEVSENFGFQYIYGDTTSYLSLEFNNSMPSYQTLSLFQDRGAFERGFVGYYERFFNRLNYLATSLDIFEANVSDGKSMGIRSRFEFSRRLNVESCYEVGALVGYSNITKSSPLLNLGYLKNSVPYYLLMKCNNRHLRSLEGQKWIYGLDLGIGGDLGRGIGFVHSNMFRAELSYLFSPYNSVKLYGEHYTEALNVSRGATSMIGVQGQFFLF